MNKKGMKDLVEKYKQKMEKELGPTVKGAVEPKEKVISREYIEFKEDYLPGHLSFYEKLCNLSEKFTACNR